MFLLFKLLIISAKLFASYIFITKSYLLLKDDYTI